MRRPSVRAIPVGGFWRRWTGGRVIIVIIGNGRGALRFRFLATRNENNGQEVLIPRAGEEKALCTVIVAAGADCRRGAGRGTRSTGAGVMSG